MTLSFFITSLDLTWYQWAPMRRGKKNSLCIIIIITHCHMPIKFPLPSHQNVPRDCLHCGTADRVAQSYKHVDVIYTVESMMSNRPPLENTKIHLTFLQLLCCSLKAKHGSHSFGLFTHITICDAVIGWSCSRDWEPRTFYCGKDMR